MVAINSAQERKIPSHLKTICGLLFSTSSKTMGLIPVVAEK